jgi:hypothetical protein
VVLKIARQVFVIVRTVGKETTVLVNRFALMIVLVMVFVSVMVLALALPIGSGNLLQASLIVVAKLQ